MTPTQSHIRQAVRDLFVRHPEAVETHRGLNEIIRVINGLTASRRPFWVAVYSHDKDVRIGMPDGRILSASPDSVSWVSQAASPKVSQSDADLVMAILTGAIMPFPPRDSLWGYQPDNFVTTLLVPAYTAGNTAVAFTCSVPVPSWRELLNQGEQPLAAPLRHLTLPRFWSLVKAGQVVDLTNVVARHRHGRLLGLQAPGDDPDTGRGLYWDVPAGTTPGHPGLQPGVVYWNVGVTNEHIDALQHLAPKPITLSRLAELRQLGLIVDVSQRLTSIVAESRCTASQ